jgi:tetratricopeptide (TPR) repeat protein
MQVKDTSRYKCMRKISIVCFLLFSLSVYGCSSQENLSYEQHFAKGTEYFGAKKLDKAINEYKKALKLNPSAADAHYYLGLAYDQKWRESFNAAAQKYTEDMLKNPKLVPKAAIEGNYEYYGEKREFKNLAIEEFKEAAKYDPNNWMARYLIATDYLNNGVYDEAIKEYKQVIKTNPNYSNAYGGMASAYSKKGLYDLAIEKHKQAIAVDPNSTHDYYELGLIYLKRNEKKKALEMLEKLKSLNSTFHESLKSEIYK